MKHTTHNRRTFIKQTSLGAMAAGLISHGWAEESLPMPMRPLGKTGEKVSLLCLGGFHVGTIKEDSEAVRFVKQAIDMGVTFLDNAWEYHQGRSEDLMGQALQDGYRDKVFLMTKHHGRDKQTALQHLDDSLQRLRTDCIDLWQFHEVVYERDPEMIFAESGGIEAAVEAKQAGKVRYIGFTGHKDPEIFKKMLSYDFEWDAVQMPLSVLDAHFKSFEKQILPVCLERGIGVLAMKTLASGFLQRANVDVTMEEAMQYVMNLPVSTVVSGINTFEHLEQNVGIAKRFKTLSPEHVAEVLDKTRLAAADGQYEPFKTTRQFDGPVGRKLHGIES